MACAGPVCLEAGDRSQNRKPASPISSKAVALDDAAKVLRLGAAGVAPALEVGEELAEAAELEEDLDVAGLDS